MKTLRIQMEDECVKRSTLLLVHVTDIILGKIPIMHNSFHGHI